MTWVRLDDDFYHHPKVLKAGPLCIAMQVAGLCYCNHYLTDGFIPESSVSNLLNIENARDSEYKTIVSKLVACEMWEPVEGGYQIHDFLDYQPSKEQVLEERSITQTRKALHENPFLIHKIKERDKDHCRYCGNIVSWQDKRGASGATYDHVIPDGGNTLENVVVSCRSCNSKKGKRTPEQAGMVLLNPFRVSKSDLDTTQIKFVNPVPNPNPNPNPKVNIVGANNAPTKPPNDSTQKKTRKPKAQSAEPKLPRERDVLFDAIASVCCIDPATAGASVGKVRAALSATEPPYSADEVKAFGVWWNSDEWRKKKGPPTLWKLKEQIGIVRNGNGHGQPATASNLTPAQQAIAEMRAERMAQNGNA